MPTLSFSCQCCGKNFDKILLSIDISGVLCCACNSPDFKRLLEPPNAHSTKASTTIPAGALSGGSCRSGFS